MRMAPFAVWLSKIENEAEILNAVKIETNHTHPNQTIVECNQAFALCVRSLLNGEGHEAAYQKVKEFCQQSQTGLKFWFEEMEKGDFQQVNRKIGWVKIAFQQSMKYLKMPELTYEQAMSELLVQGGDTDTNAAIVGMVLGARDGLSSLDPKMIQKVDKYRVIMGGHKRPDFFIPGKTFPETIDGFLENLPTKLVMLYDSDIEKMKKDKIK